MSLLRIKKGLRSLCLGFSLLEALFLKRAIRNKEKEGPLTFMLNTWTEYSVCVCESEEKAMVLLY